MKASEFNLPKGTQVFVDMDGVLADLFNHAGSFHDVEHYNHMTPEQWEKFFKDSNAYELFKSLPVFPTANKLLQMVVNYAGGYSILSSPLNFDREGSIKGKREWLQKHIHVPAENIIFEHEKYKYAKNPDGTPNILIDDYGVNIRAWEQAGGIAIKYQADEDSLQKVFHGLKAAARGVKENWEDIDSIAKDLENKFDQYSTFYAIVDRATGRKINGLPMYDSLEDAKEDQYYNNIQDTTKIVIRKARGRSIPSKNTEVGEDIEYNKSNNWGLSEEDAEAIIDHIQMGEQPSQLFDTYPGLEDMLEDFAHMMGGQYYWDAIIDALQSIEDGGMEVDENFADGKHPGRKGLAKRSGVNTKASVSSLRKTAKHSTGEKARMAHWLANMKAGRAKHKHEDVEEGWRDIAAAGALGTALAFGGAGDAAAKTPTQTRHTSALQQVSKQEIAKTVTGNPHEVLLRKAAEKAGIKGQELVAFLSQCAHETLDFKHMEEIGGSLDFRKYDPKYAPKKARVLGNKEIGDGAKYKGRGYIQLTGRDNYKKAGQALGLPLEQKPELVKKPEVAAKVAVWYWKSRVAPKVGSFKNTTDVTKGINPGLKHLDQRKEKQKSFQVAMK